MRLIPTLLILLTCLVANRAEANQESRTEMTVFVNVAYASNSLWTEPEIRKRFEFMNSIYQKACQNLTINIKLNEVIRIEAPELQSIQGYLTHESVDQMKKILFPFLQDLRPTLIYVNSARDPHSVTQTENFAQAYTLDGPRPLDKFRDYAWNNFSFQQNNKIPFIFIEGSLPWERLEELRPLHGTALIAQAYSKEYQKISKASDDQRVVEIHELGHILLNDGSHRFLNDNIMGGTKGLHFDPDQCDLISAYYEMEPMRDKAIANDIHMICNEARKLKPSADVPKFCEHHKHGAE